MKCILGKKIEMTQIFGKDGEVIPVTLVSAEPNVVVQVKTVERDGYAAIQLGTHVTKKPLSKPQAGHVRDLPSVRTLAEFRVEKTDLKRGDVVDVSAFEPGMVIDVTGTSKGKGFQGVVHRHHFRGSPATHGNKDQLRMPGSIATHRQGPVARGQRMGGHMGDEQVTVRNLEVVAVYPEKHQLAIKGAVPGARGGLLAIKTRDGKDIWQA
jgi:large subunit ribosomal protein L3